MSEEFISHCLDSFGSEYMHQIDPEYTFQNYISTYMKYIEIEGSSCYNYVFSIKCQDMVIYENEEVIRYAIGKTKELGNKFDCGCNFDDHFDTIPLNMIKLSVELSKNPCMGNLEKFCNNSFEIFKYVFDLYEATDIMVMMDKYFPLCNEEKKAYLMSRISIL